ncbi:monosaccharide ABC transporter membrane protein, CUT2 family [Streptosporangium subroseum]|jgi:ribose transport system permease protein|uniref:Monosaccharide ABC transporter membrane protein, CUT2 family n=1 Tax=Streptosporangium subroseum TaxID=106412 RepID=A0A239P1C0_9ACTN|nr:ABC transporter permease [Streptosporangium subroseum]SNT60927.1 monosaccharide ABC transporter membrane protein, CUT2 family [Streptosporangium subroseum]
MTGQLTNTRRYPRLVLGGRDLTVEVVFVTLVVLLVAVAASTSDTFLTQTNLTNLLKQMVTTGLLAFGMLVVILTGGIDLSVGSVVAFSGILSAGLVSGLPLPVAIVAGLAAGIVFGLINGTLVARFGLAPFVVTLAALTTIRGLAFVYSEVPISPENESFLTLGSAMVGPIPLSTVIMLAVFLVGGVFLTRTPAGRSIVAIGGNAETVRLAGINVRKHVILAYAISGACAGLAGVILASRVGIAQPSVGVAFELDAIAACVIGGASLAGGRGSAKATFGGVLVLVLINNLLNLYGVQSFWQQVLKGLIIIAVILVQRTNRART